MKANLNLKFTAEYNEVGKEYEIGEKWGRNEARNEQKKRSKKRRLQIRSIYNRKKDIERKRAINLQLI